MQQMKSRTTIFNAGGTLTDGTLQVLNTQPRTQFGMAPNNYNLNANSSMKSAIDRFENEQINGHGYQVQ